MRLKKEIVFLGVIAIIGIIFRLLLTKIAPQPFIWDQVEYEMYAVRMLHSHFWLAAFGNRPYPYSLLLTIIYSIAGVGNHEAVYIVQAVMDSLVAIMIYYILRIGLKTNKMAWIGSIMYAINPFTAGYAGTILSEPISTFLLTATILGGIIVIRKPTIIRALAFGLVTGLTCEARAALLPWIIIPIGLMFFYDKSIRKPAFLVSILLGILLTFLYPLYTNWQTFHEPTISTVDNIFAMEFFNGVIIKQLPNSAAGFPPAFFSMMGDYYSESHPWRTPADRHAIAQKYMALAWEGIWADPGGYAANRFYKMWSVWQKAGMFPLVNPFGDFVDNGVYVINLFLFLLAFIGIAFGGIVGKKGIAAWTFRVVAATFVYATVMFSVTQGDTRLTIPFYPILIVLSSIAIMSILHVVRIVDKRSW